DRDRFSAIVYVMPVSFLALSGSAGIGRESYPGTKFGLRNNDNNVYSAGVDYVPNDKVNFGITYGWEKYTALQASRTSNPLPDPTFNDARRDWTDDSAEKVNTLNVSLDLLKIFPKTEVRLGYNLSDATSTYVYGLVAGSPVAAPSQLPAVNNRLRRATVDAKYFLTQHLAVGGVYWYDDYTVSDFALGPQPGGLALPATASPAIVLMGYQY